MTSTQPYLLDLSYRGFIEGVTHLDAKNQTKLCHYFGGIPYALPPLGPYRWRQARPLPACYRYGTRANPARFTGGAALCPQPGFLGPPEEPELFDEDCLQLNIWMPVRQPPNGGWPVLFFIHGGWLQFGTPNHQNLTAMLGETDCQCVVILPAYRVNIFGFLASREIQQEATGRSEPVGNFGFWDQRLALEWTYKNVSFFGGDASNITVSGLSAGAHSVFHNLSYDLFLDASRRIIRRALMISNGAGMQPKSLSDSQEQFDSLLDALSIPLSISSSEKLTRLRAIPYADLLAAISKIALHEFRSWSDGTFVRTSLFNDIESGAYAQKLEEARVHLIMGEVCDEHFVYGAWRPPKEQSLLALQNRLYAEYPAPAVDALLQHYCPGGQLPQKWGSWGEAFGYIYADLQVHALERGLVYCLVKGGAGDLVHRYRIEWRAGCVELPKEWGVTHSSDMPIWFWGNGIGAGLTEQEKKVVEEFLWPFWSFVAGKEMRWTGRAPQEVRRLTKDGKVDVWEDTEWDRGVRVWQVARDAIKVSSQQELAKH